MKRPKSRLPVIYADDALAEIDEIADWNEQAYGRAHAKHSIRFLERHIDALAKDFAKGRAVSTRPDLRFIQKEQSVRTRCRLHLR